MVDVFDTFRGYSSAFINSKVDRQLKNLIKHIDKDCLPDPEGIDVYVAIDRGDEASYAKFKSLRGTYEPFHYHGRRATKSNHMSPELYDISLNAMIYRWNMERSVDYNHLPTIRSFSVRKLNDIKRLFLQNQTMFSLDPLPEHDILKGDFLDELEDDPTDGYYRLESLDVELFGARWLFRPTVNDRNEPDDLSDDQDVTSDSGSESESSSGEDAEEEDMTATSLQDRCMKLLKGRAVEFDEWLHEMDLPPIERTVRGHFPTEVCEF